MVNIYIIKNSEKGTRADFSEPVLIDSIRYAKLRNKKLYKALVDIWETLNNKVFDEERELGY